MHSQTTPSSHNYELVATADGEHIWHHPRRAHRHHSVSRRRIFFLLLAFLPSLLLALLFLGTPPSYDGIRAYERRLPQHDLAAAEKALYIRFPDHLWGHGFNNVLQECLALSYLAYAANRSFVFEDYVWSRIPLPYTLYDLALRPKRVPLNAFIAGPPAGAAMDAPLAVSAEFYKSVCKTQKVHSINAIEAPIGEDGAALAEWWTRRLRSTDAQCVEITSTVFDFEFFGGPRLLALWPTLSTSPILANFSWSQLVLSALSRNFALFPPGALDNARVQGLVAVHLRRGDYKRHCPRLAEWRAEYMGFNRFAGLPDTFNASTADADDYTLHCLPDIHQVVQRLHEVRRTHGRALHSVYMLTNAWSSWVAGLREALLADGWGTGGVVVTTGDLVLDAEQRWVDAAVDMAIAERAEVFVGNGFSSLSANIVMLRVAKGMDLNSNRFL